MELMMEVRLMMNRRSALAISAPRPKASRTTARKAKRNSATANEPTVRSKRIFLRRRFAKIRRLYFMPASPRHPLRLCRFHEQTFVQMKYGARPARDHRIVGNHQHGLAIAFYQLFDQ